MRTAARPDALSKTIGREVKTPGADAASPVCVCLAHTHTGAVGLLNVW
jgi:hypothetical protein